MSSSTAWINGCFFTIAASVVGAASNLCIRYSYLQQRRQPHDASIDDTTARRHFFIQFGSAATTQPDSSNGDEVDVELTASSSNSTEESDDLRITADNTKINQPLFLRTIGILGISVLNPILNITALHYASPSILSPLGGLSLVFMVLLSEPMIGESASSSSMQLGGAALIVAGECVLALFGDHTNDLVLTMSDIREQYTEYAFVTYFVGLSIWMMMVAWWVRWGNPTWQRFAWGIAAGSMSGSNPFLKDGMAVLAGMMTNATTATTSSNNDALRSIGFYVLILLAGIIPLSSLILSLECMKRYNATYSAACHLASMTVSATLMSMARYHTWDHLSNSYALLYPFGLVVLLVGCIVLAMEDDDDCDIVARKNQNREMKLLLSEQKIEYGTVITP